MKIAALRSTITAVFDLGPNARQLLRLLLAEIDDPAETDRPNAPTNGSKVARRRATWAAPTRQPAPATVARRQRKERAQLRQAAGATNGETAPPASANDWPQLRQLREHIKA
ncbi:MAG: hypothetical protein WB611_33595, partial [Stellaceae bacterium]